MPYQFDENKYKKIFDRMYGPGSFDSGLSDARAIGRSKANAEYAKQQYQEQIQKQKAEARKREAEARLKSSPEYSWSKKVVDAFTREQQDKENDRASNASLKAPNPIKGAGTVGQSYWASMGIPVGHGTTKPTPKSPNNKWVNPYTRDELKQALATLRKAKDNSTLDSYSKKFNSYDSAGKDRGNSVSAYDKMQSFYKKIDPSNTPAGTTRFYDTLQTKGYNKTIEQRKEDFMMDPVVSKQHDKYLQSQKKTRDSNKSDKNGFLRFMDAINSPLKWTDKHIVQPVENKAERFATSFTDGLLGGQLKKNISKHENDTPEFVKKAALAPKTTADKATDILGELAGMAAPIGGAYKVTKPAAEGAFKLLTRGKDLGKLGKYLESGVKGGTAMASYSTANELVDAALHPHDATFGERAKNVGMNTLYGAVGDPLLRGLGEVASTGLGKLAKGEVPTYTGKPGEETLSKLDPNNQNPIAKLQDLIHRASAQNKTEPSQLKLPENIKPQKGYTNISPAPKSKVPGALPPSELDNHGYGLIDLQGAKAKTQKPNPFDVPYKQGDVLPDTRTHIGSKTEKGPLNIKDKVNKGVIKTVDNLHRLNQFDEQVQKVLGRDLKASEKTHVLGLNSRGSDQISKQILTQNLVDKSGKVVGKSLKEITMKVPKGKLKDFEDYLVNRHAITRMERGEKVFPNEMNMTTGKSKEKVNKYEVSHPEFKELAKEYYNYNKQLGQKWLVDTGILSKDQWEGYLKTNPHYVPNNRIFSDLERPAFGNNARKGFANQTNPVKKATGSQRKIVSPIESTIEHTAQYIKTAKRNEVMQTLINNIKKNPEVFKDWAEIVPTDKAPQDLIETLQKEGVDGILENINKGFDQKPDLTKGNIIRGLIDGKPVHVKVNDPALLDALTNLQPKAQNLVIHSLGQVTRVMKNLTTGINPVFSLTRNIWRDIPTAYTNSKSTNNPFVFSKDLVQAVVSVIKNDDLYRSFKAVGGGHSSPVSSDVNLLSQSKRSILPQKGIKPLLGKGLGALENLNNAVEAAPRLAEFKRIAGNDYDSKMKALFEANDVTVNFNKYGNWSKEVDAIIPYFNAAVQGLDKFGRVFFSPKATAAQKTMAGVKAFTAVTIPSIALYAMNHDNPDYQKLSNYIKDGNFLIPKGDGTFIKIPKSRELGVLFGSDVERTLRAWNDKDPKAFKDFSTFVLEMFMPPTRTIAAPFSDIRSNKNFMGAPIVPGDLEGLSPKYQYDSQTSEVAKKLGNLTNVSPKQLDYLAKSYGGVLGELGIPATTKNTTIGQALKQKVTADPVFSSDMQADFYKTKTKLDQAHNDLTKQGVKSKDLNETLRKVFNKKSLQMGKVRKEMKTVQNNSNLSAAERLKRVRQLQEMINQIAESGNKLVR